MATFDEIVVGQGTAAEHGALVELALRAARGDAQAAEQLQRLTLERGVDAADVLRFLGSHEAFQALVIQQDVDREAIARLAEEHPALVRVALLRGLFLAAVEGRDERGIEQIAAMFERVYDFGLLLADAMDVTLQAWIDEAEARLEKACRIVLGLAPHDPSIEENQAVDEAVQSFQTWERYPYHTIIVPGFTPKEGPGKDRIHPRLVERLARAKEDFDAGHAPFVLVSGGNVWVEDPGYYEALEMKKALVRMGTPAERVIVDARARHSTTNLRNAGRYMLRRGLSKALVTTTMEQDFYYSFADLSTFHARCMLTLGYRVGELEDVAFDPVHSVYEPARLVFTINYRDPLDP